MARFLVAFLSFFMASIDARAQSGWDWLDDSPERLIGLLDLDDIVRGGCGSAPERATARVFSVPSQTSSVAGTIYWHEDGDTSCGLMFDTDGGGPEVIPTMESGYEIPAAIVYERRGSWFRIRLKNGSAWIQRRDSHNFLPYPDVLRERLAHTLQTWDGTLRETPGSSGRIIPLGAGWNALLDRALSIEFLGSRRAGNDVWIHIRLLSETACDRKLEGVATVSGWIPAYRPNRSPSAWFSSRGC
jgi:hypothetical protein